MRFYTNPHPFDCGIDLHARSMYVCILSHDGEMLLHRNLNAAPEPFLQAVAPSRDGLVVAIECLFTWYWLADLGAAEGIPCVLGHARSMQAMHGGTAKNDQIDFQKIAALLRCAPRATCSAATRPGGAHARNFSRRCTIPTARLTCPRSASRVPTQPTVRGAERTSPMLIGCCTIWTSFSSQRQRTTMPSPWPADRRCRALAHSSAASCVTHSTRSLASHGDRIAPRLVGLSHGRKPPEGNASARRGPRAATCLEVRVRPRVRLAHPQIADPVDLAGWLRLGSERCHE